MSDNLTLRCVCNAEVPFTADDRGLDVYCPSCGRACSVPVENIQEPTGDESNLAGTIESAAVESLARDAPTLASSSSSSRRKVFSRDGSTSFRERIAYTAACRCGSRTPVMIGEVGETLYCPTCGAELPSLEKNEAVSLGVASEETLPATTTPRRRRGVMLAAGLFMAAVAVSISLTKDYWQSLIDSLVRAGATSELPPSSFTPEPEVTLAEITNLLTLPDVEHAVAECDRLRGRLRSPSAPPDDPRRAELHRVRSVLVNRPAYITTARIQELPQRRNLSSALVQARLWQEALTNESVPSNDDRGMLLAAVTEDLLQKLYPQAAVNETAIQDRFRGLLSDLSQHLTDDVVPACAPIVQKCDELLVQHAEELAAQRTRYDRLRADYLDRKNRLDRLTRIKTDLGRAEELFRGNDLSLYVEAAERLSRAKFTALTTPLTKEEAGQLHNWVSAIHPEMRFARGRRAVEDAVRFDAERDLASRRVAVVEAAGYLAGIEERRIAPYMDRLKPWLNEKQPASAPAPPAAASRAQRLFALRNQYERFLDAFGKGETVSGLSEGLAVDAVISADPSLLIEKKENLSELVCDLIEYALFPQKADSNRQTERLQIERILSTAQPSWRELERWVHICKAVAAVAAEPPAIIAPEPSKTVPPNPTAETSPDRSNGGVTPARAENADQSITNSIGMKLVLIPVGEFMMGLPASEANPDLQEIQHKVKITKPFYLCTTEVTQGQWKLVMGTEPWKGKLFVHDGADYPATYVSWNDATEFCRKLTELERAAGRLRVAESYTLPTEAQWEYACRAGTTTAYSFGSDASELGKYAWYHKNASDVDENYAHSVATKQANPWGLYDMHGNVFEWCADWYDAYGTGAMADPRGAQSGSYRVRRGGDWLRPPRDCWSATRSLGIPTSQESGLGLRVASVEQ